MRKTMNVEIKNAKIVYCTKCCKEFRSKNLAIAFCECGSMYAYNPKKNTWERIGYDLYENRNVIDNIKT